MAARLLNLQARLELQVRGSIARQLAITISTRRFDHQQGANKIRLDLYKTN
jgi:hypothetical protein